MKTTIAILCIECWSWPAVARISRWDQPPQGVQAQAIEKQAGFSADGLRFSAVVMPDSEAPLAFRIPGLCYFA